MSAPESTQINRLGRSIISLKGTSTPRKLITKNPPPITSPVPNSSESLPRPVSSGIEPVPQSRPIPTPTPIPASFISTFANLSTSSTGPAETMSTDSTCPVVDPEHRLLSQHTLHDASNISDHERKNTPVFTADALPKLRQDCPQRAVLGSVISQHAPGFPSKTKKPQIYVNANTPFSSVICGVQGSGKSHTASVLLEGCLLPNPAIGTLPKPLAGLCLHYDTQAATFPCEAAYLSMPSPESVKLGESNISMVPVVVLVAPTSVTAMSAVYKNLPHVKVRAFHLSAEILNSRRMLSLMGCDDTGKMPLYLQRALTILRGMGVTDFDYDEFKYRMQTEDLNTDQRNHFQMRIEMLDSYLTSTGRSAQACFKAGRLVIVDLRDPFMNSSMVSALFEIVVDLFTEAKISSGKVLLLDEAHKYLGETNSCSKFTTSIVSLIRQQRHFGIRTLIATQEPTVIPHAILGLASSLIIHRFSSPAWAQHLSRHICTNDEQGEKGWMNRITELRLGEAMVVAPSGLGVRESDQAVVPFSTGFIITRTRQRLTLDGGCSITACDRN